MVKWVEGERFVNPYNFVPFAAKETEFVMPKTGLMTGMIACEIKVLTPLFIPNTSNPQVLHEKNSNLTYIYDFFSYTDLRAKNFQDHCYVKNKPSAPVIPGSEIRGAVRSVYEAAFQGCLSQVDLNRTLGRRSPKPKLPGILKKKGDQWIIVPCQRLMLKPEAFKPDEHVKKVNESQRYQAWEEGKAVYVKTKFNKPQITDIAILPDLGLKKGYLHKGEKFENKTSESVFIESKSSVKVSFEAVQCLKKVLEEYRDKKINKQIDVHETWYPEYSVDGERVLVYYQLDNQKNACYLSPACIGKEIFQQNLKEILRVSGVEPCENRERRCAVCALFGMVSKEKQEDGGGALSSRVRFSDASLLPPEKGIADYAAYYFAPITLPEMGEPKPGAVEFYTLPPMKKEVDSYGYWTYDYQMNGTGKSRNFFTPVNRLKLRGRKFYWHSDAWKEYISKEEAKREGTEMREQIRPLNNKVDNTSVKFVFNIYFEDITQLELQRLCWALNFDDVDCAHKLGRGKPLGFGSVRIKINSVSQRKVDRETGVWCEGIPIPKEEWSRDFATENENTDAITALKQILNWEKRFPAGGSRPMVRYPEGEAKPKRQNSLNDKASHQWFRGNRTMASYASGNHPLFAKVLPKISEEVASGNNSKCEEKWLYKLTERQNNK